MRIKADSMCVGGGRLTAWLIALAVAGVSSASLAHDPGYVVVNLGSLPGATTTYALAINDQGNVTGYCYMPEDQTFHAFLWADGNMTDLGPIESGDSLYPADMDSSGTIIGWQASTSAGHDVARRYGQGQWSDLFDDPDLSASRALAVNDAGQIVGWATHRADNLDRAFVWQNGSRTDLSLPNGANESAAHGINETGLVAGWARFPVDDVVHAIVWRDGNAIDLGTLPGGRNSTATDINDYHTVTGWSEDSEGMRHAFAFSGGRMMQLPGLGPHPSYAISANNGDEFVGAAYLSSNKIWQAAIWRLGVITNLNALLPPGSEWDYISEATDLNRRGQIIGVGYIDGVLKSFLLEPQLTLTTPIPGNAGEVNRFDAAGATPGNAVYFVYGFDYGSFEIPGCPGMFFDIDRPRLLGSATADDRGHALLDLFVPSAARGRVVVFQAVEHATCDVATLISWTFY